MKKIEATFRVVTPMFMSGGDQRRPEFRIPSLLGVLRFWYRATAPQNMQTDIGALRQAEAKLFGSTDKGQAQFLARVDKDGTSTSTDNRPKWRRRSGISYLGFGPITYQKEKGNIVSQHIRENSIITVKFIFRPIVRDPDIDGLKRAIIALSLFGGLGSRSRRGFGSVVLESLTDKGKNIWAPPQNISQLKKTIINFIDGSRCKEIKGLPEYTAFSSGSKVVFSEISKDPFTVLDDIGREMIRYRSYGRSQHGFHVLPWGNEEAKQRFSKDHDLLLLLDKGVELDKHPERVIFGLPHNYFFQTTGLKVDITGGAYKRRASPLFIHVHQLAKEYVAVLTYLPAKFLPDGENIKMVANNPANSKMDVPCSVDEKVITDFLKDISSVTEVL